jgi:hypothetical protein
MNSSISSSDDGAAASRSGHRAFLVWVAVVLSFAWLVNALVPWGGILVSQDNHQRVGTALGSDLDFVVLGDSKAGPFETDCLMPWLNPYRGAVFGADSVPPVYHLDTLRRIRDAQPGFAPAVVFLFVGANNINANGLHATRDFTFFVRLPLRDALSFSVGQGQWLTFTEVLFSRVLPVYGHRVMITHLQVGSRGARRCPDPSAQSFAQTEGFELEVGVRDPVADRNYYDIYRRSMYVDYKSSRIEIAAFEDLLELIKAWGGRPIVVFPPVTSEIRRLEDEMIGDAFDESMSALIDRAAVDLMDLRDVRDFDFKDVNHLSMKGAHDLARAYFLPILREAVSR